MEILWFKMEDGGRECMITKGSQWRILMEELGSGEEMNTSGNLSLCIPGKGHLLA